MSLTYETSYEFPSSCFTAINEKLFELFISLKLFITLTLPAMSPK